MKDYLVDRSYEGVLVFTINRAEKRNAINYEVMDGLQEAINEASENEKIKILIITSAGGQAFCAGGDLETFHGLRTEEQAYAMLKKMGDILYQLAVLPKVTVALIDGSAVGGGCEIAAACDFRFARKGVKLGFIQGRLAITTGWGGGAILMEKIPYADALYLLGTAGLYTSERMKQSGFINELFDQADVPSVISHLEGLLKNDVHVLAAYKKSVKEKWEAGRLNERIENEIRQCAKLWEKDEHHKAVESFLSKK